MLESMNTFLAELNIITQALRNERIRAVYTPYEDVAYVFAGREYKSSWRTSKFVVTPIDGGGFIISIEHTTEDVGYDF